MPRQAQEYYKSSEIGASLGAINSQFTERCVWLYKNIFQNHSNCRIEALKFCSKVAIACTEGAMSMDLPNYAQMKRRERKITNKIWQPIESEKENNEWLSKCCDSFKYVVEQLRTMSRHEPLPEEILNIVNVQRESQINDDISQYLNIISLRIDDLECEDIDGMTEEERENTPIEQIIRRKNLKQQAMDNTNLELCISNISRRDRMKIVSTRHRNGQ